jgi:SAM-dependent methyltransferase
MTSREEQVRVEARLATELLAASARQRRVLYGRAYDEIFSMWFSREPEVWDFGATPRLIPTVLRHTRPGQRVLEVGCGTGLLAVALRDAGRVVTAVDVSEVALDRARRRAGKPDGVEFRRVAGTELPFSAGSFDFAYSVEVVEHLHEEDVLGHFAESARVLKPGARYWFMTPSRYAPSDANDRFGVTTEVTADVHLKVWTHSELRQRLRRAGFDRVSVPFADSGRYSTRSMPSRLAGALERVPNLPTSKLGHKLGLNQCIVAATTPTEISPGR